MRGKGEEREGRKFDNRRANLIPSDNGVLDTLCRNNVLGLPFPIPEQVGYG